MRIVLVNSAWPQSWGGGEKWTVEAAAWLHTRGHAVLVVGRPQSRLAEAARQKGLAVIETPFGGDFDPFAMLRASKILKQFSAEIAVVNFNKEAWQFGLAGKLRHRPVIARHGLTVLNRKWHHRFLLKTILTQLIVNADSIRADYDRRGLPAENIVVIPNGIKTVDQNRGTLRERFEIPMQKKLIVGAGRLESQKRLDLFLDTAAEIARARSDVQFFIAGEGPLEKTLREHTQRLGLTARTHFAGFVPNLAAIIGDADLFMLTSEEEGTPNVLLEAMAARVACVSVRVGATPEILSGDLAANLCAQKDIAALAKRAGQLLNDDTLRTTVADAMQARVLNHFSFDGSMQCFEHVFSQMIPYP